MELPNMKSVLTVKHKTFTKRTALWIAGLFFCFSCTNKHQVYLNILEKEKRSLPAYVAQKKEADKPSLKGLLSLEDAVKIALQYNKQLLAILEEKAISKGQETEAISLVLPKIDVSAAYSHLDHTLVIKDKNVKVTELDNYSLDLQVYQPIFHGGALYAGITSAFLACHLSDEQVKGQVQKTIYDAAKAYFDVLLSESLYLVNEKAVISAKSHLEEVQNKFKEGLASNYDKIRAEVEVTNFEAELIKQQNRVNLAKTGLLKILGASLKSEINLSSKLHYVSYDMPLDKALQTALLNRPEVLSAALAVGMQEQQLKVARSDWLPKINGFAGYKLGKPEPQANTTDSWGKQWSGGINLSWSIFDGLRTKGTVDKGKALVRQREYQLKNIKEMVALNVEQALLSLQDADALIRSQNLDLKRAQEGLELAQLNFKEGIASEIVVTDALSATARSESLYYSALYQHALSRLNLDLSMGTLSAKAIKLKKDAQK